MQGQFAIFAISDPANTHQGQRKGEKSLVKSVESGDRVIVTSLALESQTVETNVPVGQLPHQLQDSRKNRIQAVG